MSKIYDMLIAAQKDFEDAKRDDNTIEMAIADGQVQKLREVIEALGCMDEFSRYNVGGVL